MNSGVRVEREEGVETWWIDRPAARNAVDESVTDGLEQALRSAGEDRGLRAVVLTGAGESAFVSGADLKFLRDASAERRARNDARMLELMDLLEALPIPVLAALNGPVVGGGTEIAFACDLRIAEPHASITMKHSAMGVSPGWGGLARLATLVGRGTAAKLLFSAQPIDPEEALRTGAIDELVGHGESLPRAQELARAIARTSPSTVARVKALLWQTYRDGPATSRSAERGLFLERAASDDHREALAAFFARREPSFRPRGEG